jgi:glycosyltransferase involved in cell wall biosynthesis
LVLEMNTNAFRKETEYPIKYPELQPEIGCAGRVERHYHIKKLSQQLVQIYEDLLTETC